MDDEPIALGAYEILADAYSAKVEAKPHNADYDRPAMISLLPEVEGRRVLDAGCGPGVFAGWLADRGAEVIGVDVSPRMVEHAERRLRGRGKVVVADLGRPLSFLESASIDLVVCDLAMDYVRDWSATFAEFARVLRAPGHLIVSAEHPAAKYTEQHPDGVYFEVERVEMVWRGFGPVVRMPSYRRPLGAMLDPLIDAGFLLERLLEPRPTPRFRERDPVHYEKLMRRPGFLCLRARKGAGG